MTERSGRTVLDYAAGAVRLLCVALVLGSLALRTSGRDPVFGGEALSSMLGAPALAGLAIGFALNVARVARGALPWSRLMLGAVVLLEWTCYEIHQAALARYVHVAAALLEVALLIQVVSYLLRAPRVAGDLPELRIGRELDRLLPPMFARIVAVECVIVWSALTSLRSRPLVQNTFGYSDSTMLKSILPAVPIIVGVDWLVINSLIPHSMLWLKVVHSVVNVYFLLWVFGVYALLKLRPNRVEGGTLYVHCGVMKSAHVALSIIEAARVVEETDVPPAGRLDVKGAPRVELTLSEPIRAHGLFRLLPATSRLLSSADDPSALCAAIASARAALVQP